MFVKSGVDAEKAGLGQVKAVLRLDRLAALLLVLLLFAFLETATAKEPGTDASAQEGVVTTQASDQEPNNFWKDTRFSLGLGYEAQFVKDVNPDATRIDSTPSLFLRLRRFRHSALLELGRTSLETRVGLVSVDSSTLNLSTWYRYEFFKGSNIQLFGSGGLGLLRDSVRLSYGPNPAFEAVGYRAQSGLGVGFIFEFNPSLWLDGEVRYSLVQDRSAQTSLAFKVGYTLF